MESLNPSAGEGAPGRRKCRSRAEPDHKPHILIAEDNGVEQAIFRQMLQNAGYFCTVIGDGEQALDCLVDMDIDAMVLDLTMPSLSGTEILRVYQFMVRPAESVPIAVVSADASAQIREECLALGAAAVLRKPVHTEALVSTVARLLRPDVRPVLKLDENVPAKSIAECPEPDRPAFDWGVLSLLEKEIGDSDFVDRVIASYINDGLRQVKESQAHFEGCRFNELQRILHGLRGASVSIGANAMVACCRELENLNQGLRVAEGLRWMAEMQKQFDATCEQLRMYRSARQ